MENVIPNDLSRLAVEVRDILFLILAFDFPPFFSVPLCLRGIFQKQ